MTQMKTLLKIFFNEISESGHSQSGFQLEKVRYS